MLLGDGLWGYDNALLKWRNKMVLNLNQLILRPMGLVDKSAVQFLIKDAFNGFPWYAEYSQVDLDELWRSAVAKVGFAGLVVTNDDGIIIGASWWHIVSPETIHGEKLKEFVSNTCTGRVLVWEDAILVHQKYQRQGVGWMLRRAFLEGVRQISNRVVILSRMRSDNIPTLLLAERLGFKKTGTRSKLSDKPPIFHEFWYLLV